MLTHKIITGDSRKLSLLKNKSIQLIVTSPPYWQLKDYGSETQIGFHDSYETYINNLNVVWKECARVLSDGCRLCINIGDQFARAVYYGRYKVIPIRTEIIRFCETIGLDYMGAIIWQKATTMHTTGGGAVMGSFPYPRNGILKIDYEFILIFKKSGKAPMVSPQQKQLSVLSKDEWNEYFASHWNFPGVRQEEHLAMYPEELPKRLIRMFSFIGETVFDPFLGSGTTSLAAMHSGRNSIGYEINAEFIPIIKNKLHVDEPSIFQNGNEFIFTRDSSEIRIDDQIAQLPYQFSDPLKLTVNQDMLSEKYGSKIQNKKCAEKPELFSVRQIFSPSEMLLSNGMKIRLIGIGEVESCRSQAIQFLIEKFLKKKVFLRYDRGCPCANGITPCYLYLENKTFMNIHLLRTGFVKLDESVPFSLLEKFKEEAHHG